MLRRWLKVAVVTTALAALGGPAALAESINDAMARAYSGNPTLQGARAGLRASDENVAQAKSGWRPTVSVQGEVRNTWVGNTDFRHQDEIVVGGVVIVPERNSTSNSNSNDPTGTVRITLSQPVFRGFRTVENIKQAKAGVRAEQQRLLATEQSTLFNAVTSYMSVFADRQFVQLQKENVSVLQAQLRAANERFEVGEITRTDVAQARASLSQAQSDLSNSQATLAGDVATYLQVIGKEPGKLIYPKIVKLPPSLKVALAQAGDINPNILFRAFAEKASLHRIEVEKSALYPQISVEAEAQHSDNIRARGENSERASVAAVMSWQLYGGGLEYSRIRQAKQLASQSRIAVVEQARAVRQAVAEAWNNYQALKEIIAAARDQVAASRLALDGVRQEYEAGTRTTLDVLNAQKDVVEARTRQVTAERNLVVTAYQLLASVGRLTARDLGLNVTYYDPQEHYDAVSNKWIGTGVETIE